MLGVLSIIDNSESKFISESYTDDETGEEAEEEHHALTDQESSQKLRRIVGRGQQSLTIYIRRSLPKDGPYT